MRGPDAEFLSVTTGVARNWCTSGTQASVMPGLHRKDMEYFRNFSCESYDIGERRGRRGGESVIV